MKSKTSIFNKTIFIKNTLRYWPMWTLYLIILFFLMPVTLFRRTMPSYFTHSADISLSKLETLANCVNAGLDYNIIFIFLLSIIYAVLIFSYLFNARNCYMIHTFPVKREELFFTGYMNGILFLVIPQILAFLMSLIVCIIHNVTCVEYLLYWLVFSIGISFLFYSAAVFCCMLTGNIFAALVYYLAGNLVYVGIKYLIFNAISALCYGMSNFSPNLSNIISTRDGFFSPITYLYTHAKIRVIYNESTYVLKQVDVTGGKIIALYLIPAVIVLILAVLFYKKRHLECAGDIVTFQWMKPIFRWIISFCAGIGLSLIFAEMFFYSSRWYTVIMILAAVILAFLCFFFSEMILQKRFRIFTKKCGIEGIICAAFILFILGAFESDLFHMERKVPSTDKVYAALLENNEFGIILTGTDDIEKLTDIHQSIIDQKDNNESYFHEYYYKDDGTIYYDDVTGIPYTTEFRVTYYLKNGRYITRSYSLPISSDYLADPESSVSQISNLQNDPDAYLKSAICENYDSITYTSGTLDVPLFSKDGSITYMGYDLTTEETQTIYEALKKDIEAGNYPFGIKRDQISNEDHYFNSLSLTGQTKDNIKSIYDNIPYVSAENMFDHPGAVTGLAAETGYMYNQIYPCFELYTSCNYTIQALIDLGIIEEESDLTTWAEYYEAEGSLG